MGLRAGLFGAAGLTALFGGLPGDSGDPRAHARTAPVGPRLVVAGVLFVLAGLAALAGRTQVEHATPPLPLPPPLPEETIAGIREDVDTVRQGVHP
jgi:hypothetical protein